MNANVTSAWKWKNAVVTYFKVLYWHPLGETEDNHNEYESGYPVIRLKFEPCTVLGFSATPIISLVSYGLKRVKL